MMGKILVIAGPTAVGKTQYAIKIARALRGEIVSCDSMQLYRHMDIGSAKPTPEERAMVPHHLVDEVEPTEDFSVRQYQKRARAAIEDILHRRKLPVVAGGTGLYLDSILYEMDFGSGPRDADYRKNLERLAVEQGAEALHRRLHKVDPDGAERIHPNNIKRVIRALEAAELGGKALDDFENVQRKPGPYDPILIGLSRDRDQLYRRINDRVLRLVDAGLIDEVKGLLRRGSTAENIAMKGIGYKEVIAYLDGNVDQATMIDTIQKNTRHFAKRQMTWFRRYDKMTWFDLTEMERGGQEGADAQILTYVSERLHDIE